MNNPLCYWEQAMTEQLISIDPEAALFARQQLLAWFQTSARSFPWRYDSDPYHVLMAEMMLRRTQARQVIAVYHRFLQKYPDIFSLDRAPAEEVADILRPLGLEWRAENFKILASELVNRYNGRIPEDRRELMSLTGVGPYVAEAVRCFAFGQPAVIMDTNTVRVTARYFGFSYTPESRRRKQVIQAVSYLIHTGQPASSNYALLDFAATVCRAQKPDHAHCPLAPRCAYFRGIQHSQEQQVSASMTTE